MPVSAEERKLKKGLGLWGLVSLGVGINVGAALFLTPPVMAGITGSSLWVARIVSVIPLLLALPAYMMLSSAWPTTAGNYRYNKLASPSIAGGIIWVWLVCLPFGLAFMSMAISQYLNQLVPGIPAQATAIVVLTVFYVLNLLSIRTVAWVEIVMAAGMLLAILLFIVPGLGAIQLQNLVPTYNGGLMGVLVVAAITFQVAGGGLSFVESGSEVRGGGRTFIPATIISILVVTVVTIVVEVIAIGSIGAPALAKAGTLMPVAAAFLPPFLVVVFGIVGSLLASTTTVHGVYTMGARDALVAGGDGIAPQFLVRVNERFGSPHWALTVLWIAACAVVIVNPSIAFLSAALNTGLDFWFMFTVIGAMFVPTRYPELWERAIYKPGRTLFYVCSALAAVGMGGFGLLSLWQLQWNSLPFIAVFIVAAVYAKVKGAAVASAELKLA